jgi:hypothetical protein
VDTEYLNIMRRVSRWLRDQSLQLYDKARITRAMRFNRERDGRNALDVQVDLYGNDGDDQSLATNFTIDETTGDL